MKEEENGVKAKMASKMLKMAAWRKLKMKWHRKTISENVSENEMAAKKPEK
jgi:hypothetical protein